MPTIVTETGRKEAEDLTGQIVTRVLGGAPRSVVYQTGGLSNYVFCVTHPAGEFIVRLGHADHKFNSYRKEQWAMAKARELGVPVPEVIDIGDDPLSYMVMRKAAGHPATVHPHRSRIIRSMGRCAAIINSIRTEGYGGRFDPAGKRLSGNPTWHDFLRSELDIERRFHTLATSGLFDSAKLDRIRNLLEHAADGRAHPVLSHGDMRLKNVIVDGDGRIQAILDWENCSSNLAPEWELSLALHDLSIDNKQEFIRGYGLTVPGVMEIADVMKALNVINYAPHVRHAVERNDAARLEWYRLRFSGALDLYSV